MTEVDGGSETVRRGAARGARSITTRRQVVADVVEATVAKWEDVVRADRRFSNVSAWAFRVGQNEAKRALRRRRETTWGTELLRSGELLLREDRPSDADAMADREAATEARTRAKKLLRAKIVRQRKILIGRQLEVMLKLCDDRELSLHAAAKELGMDRQNLKRSFLSGLARLARARK